MKNVFFGDRMLTRPLRRFDGRKCSVYGQAAPPFGGDGVEKWAGKRAKIRRHVQFSLQAQPACHTL